MANNVTPTSGKKRKIALLLCLLGGFVGLHQFYVGRFGKGFLYLCTAGLFMLGMFVDLLAILNRTFLDNANCALRE